MKKKQMHGGKREGAGRKPQGKEHYNVTLTAENVAKAKKRERNFSSLLDRLLLQWLGTVAPVDKDANVRS